VEVLGHLHTRRERLAVQGLINPRPEKADPPLPLGGGHVPERPPGGQHPPGGGMPQVDQVGQPGRPVVGDRRRHLDHLQERHRALLQAGSTPGRGPPHRAGAPPPPLTIARNPPVPPCRRVPPGAGAAISGRRSLVARSTARTSRSPAATPIEAARNPNPEPHTPPRRPGPAPRRRARRSSRRETRTRTRPPPPGGRAAGRYR